MNAAVAAVLSDKRLHLQHGPIDLLIAANGDPAEVSRAYHQACVRFEHLLQELVNELPVLKAPCTFKDKHFRHKQLNTVSSSTAQRMLCAASSCCDAIEDLFVTPMAAIAGAVADEILEALCKDRILHRASVNNGGDIAMMLSGDAQFRVGVAVSHENSLTAHRLQDCVTITANDGIGGVASSGRHGRSFSLGIADNVTVLAANAATADTAATIIASAVDLPCHPAVTRAAANSLQPDSDLGERAVVTGLAALSKKDVNEALQCGSDLATRLRDKGLINSASLSLQNQQLTV